MPSMYRPDECSLPPNIRCSNRCANPVFPGFSFFEPTWYQMLTATMGALWSSCTITVRPLSSTKRSYGISISVVCLDFVCADLVCAEPFVTSASTTNKITNSNRIFKPPNQILWNCIPELLVPQDSSTLKSADLVIPSEARDLHFAANCRSLASLGMTIYEGYALTFGFRVS